MTRLDLDQQRDGIELFTTALGLWLRHLPVFLVLALVVIAPLNAVLVSVDGAAVGAGGVLVGLVAVPALVTAMHVRAVEDLGEGRRPSLLRSLRVVARLGVPVCLVVLLYSLAVFAGLLALVAPGIFLSVHWYFGAQAVVVEGRRGAGALRRSGELVAHRWGRVFVLLIVLGALTVLISDGGTALVELVADPRGVGEVVVVTIAESLGVSLTALVGTLLFFDLRARSTPF